MDSGENYCDFESTMTTEELNTSGIRNKLRAMQSVCKDGVEVALTAIVNVTDLTRKDAETKRKNGK